jgi:hypothetical protein
VSFRIEDLVAGLTQPPNVLGDGVRKRSNDTVTLTAVAEQVPPAIDHLNIGEWLIWVLHHFMLAEVAA